MVMPYQQLQTAVRGAAPIIHASRPIEDDQLQPASIDFRLDSMVFCVWAPSLPQQYQTVLDMVSPEGRPRDGHMYKFHLDRHTKNLLEPKHTYVIQLMENCALPKGTWIEFSPKSSSGRLDVFARVLCDGHQHYDRTPDGYHGPLWVEVTPQSFHIEVNQGVSLVQGRIKNGRTSRLDGDALNTLHMAEGIVRNSEGDTLKAGDVIVEDDELVFHVDLDRPIVGFEAQANIKKVLDVAPMGDALYDPRVFWREIKRPRHKKLVLEKDKFYLLATKERLRIPHNVCGQMTISKATMGEFRVHYAGFFDPGFDAHGVLEVRASNVSFEISDGSPVCSMKFERMFEVPAKIYGQTSNNYNKLAGPSLSKQFKDRYEAWEPEYWNGH